MVPRRWLWLAAAAAAVSLTAGSASAGERSPLEDPEPVKTVRLHFDGAAAADAVQNAGIDLEHGATRVPDGIEADAVVTDSQLLKAIALGAEVVEPGEEFKWSFRTSGSQATTTAADTLLRPPAPTVRIARADYFSTKGQGFLYVEARTTLNERPNSPTAPVTMQLENDTGPGTEFESPRNMSRFVDAGEYMFHRNLFKVSTKPSRIRVTSVANGETHGVAIGNVSQWLHDVTPLTENPG